LEGRNLKELRLNKQEKEDLVFAIRCFIDSTNTELRLKNIDKEVADKVIMEFANLESKIERNLDSYYRR